MHAHPPLLRRLTLSVCASLFAFAIAAPHPASAQASDPAARNFVQAAVNSELAADANDHSAWIYRDRDVQPGHDTVSLVVDTPQGGLRRTIQTQGRTLTPGEEASETARINRYVGDTSAQARDRRNSAHDDAQAADMLRMLPQAFIWTLVSETPETITLNYRPNPGFSPPSIEARVMGQMAGEMVIRRPGDHIYTLKGRLTQDVRIGFGLVRLRAGGTFDVERRQVAPSHWQIIEQHTHIEGHALLFKTISEQEDEWKSDFRPSPARNLAEAAHILNNPLPPPETNHNHENNERNGPPEH